MVGVGKGTVGEIAFYQGTSPLRVRGYGLVMGLAGRGSKDCPNHIYKELVQDMYKQHRFSESQVGIKSMTPEQLIASTDTAVVTVVGEIPPGSVAGQPIDVYLKALPGTQTDSLTGGYLFPTELEIARSFDAIIVVFLGGVKTLSGAVVGGALLKAAKSL